MGLTHLTTQDYFLLSQRSWTITKISSVPNHIQNLKQIESRQLRNLTKRLNALMISCIKHYSIKILTKVYSVTLLFNI